MALYPSYTDINYSLPRIITPVNKTLISTYDNQGAEQRKRKWLYNKWNVQLNYQYLTYQEARTLWQFFINRHGRYESFHWIDEYIDTYANVYFGTADGETTVYNLPFKDAQYKTIYANNVEWGEGEDSTSAGDYYIDEDAAADGGDVIHFNVAPLAGYYLSCDFTGKLKIKCRFDADEMSFEQYYHRLTTVGVNLIGLHLDE